MLLISGSARRGIHPLLGTKIEGNNDLILAFQHSNVFLPIRRIPPLEGVHSALERGGGEGEEEEQARRAFFSPERKRPPPGETPSRNATKEPREYLSP